MVNFTHLHCHCEYSLLDGLPKISDLLGYVKELGMKAVALTDHGNIYGAVEFYKKAKQMGIKPILGCEMYLAFEKYWQKRPKIDDKRYHLTLLVENEKGYKNLVKLITKSYLEGFYYKPRIDEDLLFENSEGLICLSGCLQGKVPQLILANKIKEAEILCEKFSSVFGKENFYLELQNHPNIPEQKKVNRALLDIAKKYKIDVVATNDVHYLKPEDAKIQDVLMLINTGSDLADPERLTLIGDDFSFKSSEKMAEEFKEIPQAIENTQKITQKCQFEFELGKLQFPEFPNDKKPEDCLRQKCLEGLKRIYGNRIDKKVLERFEYEFKIISQFGFSSYFLIVQDFVNFARENKIAVGPGRGSVGGSLIAYLLGITKIDPLKYDLFFERFLNPERISPPDIDIDFSDERRDEIINYLSEKYGKERVAQIITFGRMNARAVVRDVGRALSLPYSFCDKLAKLIPPNFTLKESLEKIAELKSMVESDEKVKNLIDIAQRLEGVARHASRHACGVVIGKENLTEICPLQHPTQDDNAIVTQFEMNSLEDLGLLKIDILGLKNLTLIEETIELIEKNQNKKIDLDKIPLDDKETFKTLQRGETIGVFQLESDGMQKYLKELKPTKFEDVVAMIALYRPGPMSYIQEYINRKHEKKKIEYLHEKLKPILQTTYGICIYQEQLMRIAQDLAGFSLGEADILRKAVGKKIKSLLQEQEEKLITGMIKNGIDEKTAREIWQWILPFARYGFNRSHSVAYAIIAFQTAYLKTHFPLEFMVALLNNEFGNVERIGFLLKEAERLKIKVLPPDINESFEKFSIVPGKRIIRFGLLAIKNVGWNTVAEITRERERGGPFQSLEDFIFRIRPQFLNKKSLEALIKAGTLDRFEERNQLLENIEKILEVNRERFKEKNNFQLGLFEKSNPKFKIKLEKVRPASKREKLLWEKELLGLFVTAHPFEEFRKFLHKNALRVSDLYFLENLSSKIKVGGFISQIKRILTKNGKPMFFIQLEDFEKKIEVVAFPDVVEKKPQVFQENKIVMVSGKIEKRENPPKIICEDIEEILEV